MNGKIKTKFAALFAVALMITVCVVPMVGGSEDVEAATTTETVTVEGYVYDAGGVGIAGVKVYVDGKADSIYGITQDSSNAGKFTILNVPKAASVVVKVDTTSDKVPSAVGGAATVNNIVKGQTFPVITVKDAEAYSGLQFHAGTVTVKGSLIDNRASPGPDTIYLKDVAIMNGTTQVAKTKADGTYEFVAPLGTKYTLTASTGTNGITFKSAEFVAESDTGTGAVTGVDAGNNLKAEKYIYIAQITAPVGSLSVKSTPGTATGITYVDPFTLGATFIGANGGNYYAYAAITPGVITAAQSTTHAFSTAVVSFNYDLQSTNGLGTKSDVTPYTTAPNEDIAVISLLAANAISGEVKVGGIPVTGATVTLSFTSGAAKTVKSAIIDGSKYFVGYNNDPAVTEYKVNASYTGYSFDEKTQDDYTSGSSNFEASNAVKVSGNIGIVGGVEFQISANNIVTTYKDSAGKYITGSNGDYEFYVPRGSSVTVTAPENYIPKSETVSNVYADTSFGTFVYQGKVVYTGQIFLNGVPVKENISYSVNGKDGFYGNMPSNFDYSLGCGWIWEEGTGWIYKLTVDRSIEASEIFIKVGQTATGALPLTFQYDVDAEGKFVPVGITNGKFADIDVKKQDVTATVADGDLAIPGMEVEFQMLLMNDSSDTTYNKNKVVAELGKATTDAKGVAKISAAWSGSQIYRIFAVPGGESDFGTYEVSEVIVVYTSNKMNASVELDGQTVYGFYTADASAISGLEISYIEYDYNDLVGSSKATIIDNMYYIVLSDGDNVVMSVDSAKYNEISSTPVYAGHKDIKVVIKEDVKAVSVILMDNEYSDFVTIQKPTNPEKGQVVVLSAEKTCYKLQDGSFGYQYTDAAVEYKFAGWYVNGKLLTEDCDASITLKENVVISAQYEEAIKVIASEEAPEAGLDTNVLILGIVVVVIALIAVIYSVISKRD